MRYQVGAADPERSFLLLAVLLRGLGMVGGPDADHVRREEEFALE